MDECKRRGSDPGDQSCEFPIEELESRRFLSVASAHAAVAREARDTAPEEQHASVEKAAVQTAAGQRAAATAALDDSGSEQETPEAASSDSVRPSAKPASGQSAPSTAENESSDGESEAVPSASVSSGTSSRQATPAVSRGSQAPTGSSGESEGGLPPAASPASNSAAVSEAEDTSATSTPAHDAAAAADQRATLFSAGADAVTTANAGPALAAQALFGTASIAADLTGAHQFTSAGSNRQLIADATASRAARFSETLVAAVAGIAEKPGIRQIAAEFPAALASIGVGDAVVPAVPANGFSVGAAPRFHFPTINWASALSDAWDSFAQESVALPLAQVRSVRAWVVTAAVGVVDAILIGYWAWSRRRKRVFASARLSRTPGLFV